MLTASFNSFKYLGIGFTGYMNPPKFLSAAKHCGQKTLTKAVSKEESP